MASTDDVLSQVLGSDGARGEVFCRTTLGEQTALSFPPEQAHFHVIERGPCWVELARGATSVQANAGDLVLLVGGAGHRVASGQSPRVAHALWDVVPTRYDAQALTLDLSEGAPSVEMVCGRFSLDSVGTESIAGLLPPIVHLRSHAGALADWLPSMLRLLSIEATSKEPGSELARGRLVDLILVGAIRRWLEDNDEAQPGWLTALRDPVVGPALRQMHAQPGEDWTVPRLATLVGLSRSPFAARFKDRVGVSPLRYLTSWRMRMAVRLLRDGRTVGQVAEAVGYDSTAAFSRVFKREIGRPPGSVRRDGDVRTATGEAREA